MAYVVDPDGPGLAPSFTIDNRDFTISSFQSNAVLRWEYRPGSTIYLVWQREQEDEVMLGRFNLSRDARALFAAPARNVFMIKASWWVGL